MRNSPSPPRYWQPVLVTEIQAEFEPLSPWVTQVYLRIICWTSGAALWHPICWSLGSLQEGTLLEECPWWDWSPEQALCCWREGVVLCAVYTVYWTCYLSPVRGWGNAVNRNCKSNFSTFWLTRAQTTPPWYPFTDYDEGDGGIVSWGPKTAWVHLWWGWWNRGLASVPTGSNLTVMSTCKHLLHVKWYQIPFYTLHV